MWVTLLIACSGMYDGPPPDGDGAAIYGRVVGLLGGGIGDVSICEDDTDNCTESANDGDFLLEGLPEDADVLIRMSKDNHMPTIYHHNTALEQEWRKTLMTEGIMEMMANRAGLELDPQKGSAMFILWSGPDYDDYDRVDGVRFTASEDGSVFYQAGGGMPDPDLTETSSSGSGGVFNVSPGPLEMTFTSDTVTCREWFSHDFEPGEPVPVEVHAGWASYFDLVCD